MHQQLLGILFASPPPSAESVAPLELSSACATSTDIPMSNIADVSATAPEAGAAPGADASLNPADCRGSTADPAAAARDLHRAQTTTICNIMVDCLCMLQNGYLGSLLCSVTPDGNINVKADMSPPVDVSRAPVRATAQAPVPTSQHPQSGNGSWASRVKLSGTNSHPPPALAPFWC